MAGAWRAGRGAGYSYKYYTGSDWITTDSAGRGSVGYKVLCLAYPRPPAPPSYVFSGGGKAGALGGRAGADALCSAATSSAERRHRCHHASGRRTASESQLLVLRLQPRRLGDRQNLQRLDLSDELVGGTYGWNMYSSSNWSSTSEATSGALSYNVLCIAQ